MSNEYSNFVLPVVPHLANDIVWVAQPTRISPPFGDVTLVNGVGIVKTTSLISKFEG